MFRYFNWFAKHLTITCNTKMFLIKEGGQLYFRLTLRFLSVAAPGHNHDAAQGYGSVVLGWHHLSIGHANM